jgi:uncharacterized lipoprotein YddW (UPF0748 family)
VQYVALNADKPTPSNVEVGHFFLDPANSAVRGFLLSLIEEIVTDYDVDGFQLDYIRYGSSFPTNRVSYLKTTWGYTPIARQQFAALNGNVDPASLTPDQGALWQDWMNFKTDQVSGFVRDVSRVIRAEKPQVKLSAAIFPGIEDSLLKKHQNWVQWAQNGWVDFLAPMTLTSAVRVVGDDTQRVRTEANGRVPVVSGIFGAFNANTPAHVVDQVWEAERKGAAGIAVFDTAHLSTAQLKAFEAVLAPAPLPSPTRGGRYSTGSTLRKRS